jgi:AAA+ ATPase superfamily predicted ATPase
VEHTSRIKRGARMNENPFIFGRSVTSKDFYNRKKEIKKATVFLRALQSFSITGERRIGKTSFLQHIISREVLERCGIDLEAHVIISFNMGSSHEITKERFIAALVERIRKQTQIEIESGYILENVSVFDELKAYVEELASANRSLIIALDEFEIIAPILDSNFSHWMRFIFQNPNVMAITASHKTIQDLERVGSSVSPLFNIFANLTLGLFPRTEAENMIKEMFQKGGMSLKTEEISFIVDLSGENPYFIQLVGFHYYEEKKKKKEIVLEEFTGSMFHQARNQFEWYWKSLNDIERGYLMEVLKEHRDINPQIEHELVERGFLVEKNGRIHLFSKLFFYFVSEKLRLSKMSLMSRFIESLLGIMKNQIVHFFLIILVFIGFLILSVDIAESAIGSLIAALIIFVLPRIIKRFYPTSSDGKD